MGMEETEKSQSGEDLPGRVRRLEILIAALLGSAEPKASARALPPLVEYRASPSSEIDRMMALVRDSRIWREMRLIQETIFPLSRRYDTLERAVFSRLTLDELGVDTTAAIVPRFLPVRIYLSTNNRDRVELVSGAVERIVDDLGFDGKHLATAELGSWWSRWLAKSREVLSRDDVAERLQRLERAAEVQLLHKPQADVDERLVNAVAKLNESFKGIPHAAVQIGTVLFLKMTDTVGNERVVVRTLSQRELIAIEQSDRSLLSDPLALDKIFAPSPDECGHEIGADEGTGIPANTSG